MTTVKIIFLAFTLLLTACMTGPVGADRDEYYERAKYLDDYRGKIEINDESNFAPFYYSKKDREEIAHDQILRDFKREAHKFIEEDNGTVYKFTYRPCEHLSYWPTQSKNANLAINFVTFTLFPIWENLNCPVDLDVTSPEQPPMHFSTDLKISSYSLSLLIGFADPFGGEQYGRLRATWVLPARRLLKTYGDAKSKVSKKELTGGIY